MLVNKNLHFFFSMKVMKYSDVFVKYIQSEHVWTGLETK